METLEKIFVVALNSFLGKRGAKASLAASTGLTPQYLGQIALGNRYGDESTRRKIAAALGYSGARYEEFLNIGRRELGILPPEEEPAPSLGEDVVTISRAEHAEYEALKKAAESQLEKTTADPHTLEIIDLLKSIVKAVNSKSFNPTVADHTEVVAMQVRQLKSMGDMLDAIKTLTGTTQGQIEATGIAKEGIITEIKRLRDEDHEIVVADKDHLIATLEKEVEDVKKDSCLLKTFVKENYKLISAGDSESHPEDGSPL